MTMETIDTLVIGAGQAGVAMSAHLTQHGIKHLVLERHRIAQRWRAERWDSLVANGPAWHDRFPNLEFAGIDPDTFPGKETMADYFVAHAKMTNAPIRENVAVTRLSKDPSGLFIAETPQGRIAARTVVSATGSFQKGLVPPIVPENAAITQLHSSGYKHPGQLPPGAVLVVGSGSSGTQIADELNRAGRKTYLSIAPHDRPPRRYRGVDYCWWLGVLGKWDLPRPAPGTEHVTIAVSGAYGGQNIDFRRLAQEGLNLLGRTKSYSEGILTIAPDLQRNIQKGDDYLANLLDECDAYALAQGLDLPPDPQARAKFPDPACLSHPMTTLDLARENVTSIIWATGFSFDYGWLDVDGLLDQGHPIHTNGISPVPGFYFIGLPWLSRRGSSFIWGCWKDAAYLANHIARQTTDA